MVRIDTDIVNSFVEPSLRIIEQVAPKIGRLGVGEVYIAQKKVSTYDITMSSMVTMSSKVLGNLEGRVLLSLSVDMAIEIAEEMIGSAVDSFDAQAQKAIVELMGMIVGNASVELTNLNHDIKTAPVIFSYGTHERIGSDTCPFPVTVPLQSKTGTLELDLAFY